MAANVLLRTRRRVKGSVGLICAGYVVYVLSDLAFLVRSLDGNFQLGSPADLGWIVGQVLLGATALVVVRRPGSIRARPPQRASDRRMLVGSLLPVVAFLAVFVSRVVSPVDAHVHHGTGDPGRPRRRRRVALRRRPVHDRAGEPAPGERARDEGGRPDQGAHRRGAAPGAHVAHGGRRDPRLPRRPHRARQRRRLPDAAPRPQRGPRQDRAQRLHDRASRPLAADRDLPSAPRPTDCTRRTASRSPGATAPASPPR